MNLRSILNQNEICRKYSANLKLTLLLIIGSILLVSCSEEPEPVPLPDDTLNPLFTNSIVSTDIDFIKADDPSSFSSLAYLGQSRQEMPDRRGGDLFDENTYEFEASFSDGQTVGVWLHSSFNSVADAEKYAQMVTGPLGKLPVVMRKTLDHVCIHKGNETAFAEDQGHFFVLYSENMETRVSNHDLEETVFHESVHATLEYLYKEDATWIKAQTDDGAFITEYAASNSKIEDLPETAIFAYTMIKYPGRLSQNIEEWISTNLPNRLAFFREVFK